MLEEEGQGASQLGGVPPEAGGYQLFLPPQ